MGGSYSPSVVGGTDTVTVPIAEDPDQQSTDFRQAHDLTGSPGVVTASISDTKKLGKMTKTGDSEYMYEFRPLGFFEEQLEKLKQYKEKYKKLDSKQQVVVRALAVIL